MPALYYSVHTPETLLERIKKDPSLKKNARIRLYTSAVLPEYKCIWSSVDIPESIVKVLQLELVVDTYVNVTLTLVE